MNTLVDYREQFGLDWIDFFYEKSKDLPFKDYLYLRALALTDSPLKMFKIEQDLNASKIQKIMSEFLSPEILHYNIYEKL